MIHSSSNCSWGIKNESLSPKRRRKVVICASRTTARVSPLTTVYSFLLKLALCWKNASVALHIYSDHWPCHYLSGSDNKKQLQDFCLMLHSRDAGRMGKGKERKTSFYSGSGHISSFPRCSPCLATASDSGFAAILPAVSRHFFWPSGRCSSCQKLCQIRPMNEWIITVCDVDGVSDSAAGNYGREKYDVNMALALVFGKIILFINQKKLKREKEKETEREREICFKLSGAMILYFFTCCIFCLLRQRGQK